MSHRHPACLHLLKRGTPTPNEPLDASEAKDGNQSLSLLARFEQKSALPQTTVPHLQATILDLRFGLAPFYFVSAIFNPPPSIFAALLPLHSQISNP
jgi:hypothetical protein